MTEPFARDVEALRKLSPRPADLDRDRLFFALGRASLRRRLRAAWGTAGISTGLSCCLAFLLWHPDRPVPTTIMPSPVMQAPPRPEPTPSPAPAWERRQTELARLREALFTHGLDALPPVEAATASPSFPELPLDPIDLPGDMP